MNFSIGCALFFSAFLAATLFPAQSELSIIYLVTQNMGPLWLLLIIATIGNTLGSVVNWILGRFSIYFESKKWFPINKNTLQKYESWYHKYGKWTLLLSWAPIIGDPLTIVAGFLREPFWSFLIIVGIAKFLRYLAIILMTMQI